MFGDASRHAMPANDVEELAALDPEQETGFSLRIRKDIRMPFLNIRLRALQSLDANVAVADVLRCQCADFTRTHAVIETHEQHDIIPLRMFLGHGQKCNQFVSGQRVHCSFSCAFYFLCLFSFSCSFSNASSRACRSSSRSKN